MKRIVPGLVAQRLRDRAPALDETTAGLMCDAAEAIDALRREVSELRAQQSAMVRTAAKIGDELAETFAEARSTLATLAPGGVGGRRPKAAPFIFGLGLARVFRLI